LNDKDTIAKSFLISCLTAEEQLRGILLKSRKAKFIKIKKKMEDF
jgi:hypothetical protein